MSMYVTAYAASVQQNPIYQLHVSEATLRQRAYSGSIRNHHNSCIVAQLEAQPQLLFLKNAIYKTGGRFNAPMG
jgi:hypothetical protein